jgi:spore germination protein (amino acid permease)
MENKITFGRFEATCITLTLLSTQLFLNLPRLVMESVWTAGWILTIYITVVSFFLFMIIAKLYVRFEGKDLLDLGEYIGGNIGRIIVGLIVTAFLLYITPIILREFSEDMKIISLPQSPLSFVMFFFLAGMVVAAYLGIEAIVRYSAIVVPIIAVGYLLIIAGSIQYFDVSRITPVLGKGLYAIFVEGLPRISVFAGIINVFLIFPFMKTNKNFKTVGYASIIISGLFFTIGVLAFSLVYQYPTGTESFLPMYQLARLIDYGRFFERIESIFVPVWVVSALFHLSILLFLIVHVFKKTFNLKYHRPLILPFAILIYTFSFLPQNLISAIELEKSFRNFAWTISFLLPLLLLIIARVIKKRSKKEESKA